MPDPVFVSALDSHWQEKLATTVKISQTQTQELNPSHITLFNKLQKQHKIKENAKQTEITKLRYVSLYPCINCNKEFTHLLQLEQHIEKKCVKIIDPFINPINEFLGKFHQSSLKPIEFFESMSLKTQKFESITNHKFKQGSHFYKSMNVCLEFLQSKNNNFTIQSLRPEKVMFAYF